MELRYHKKKKETVDENTANPWEVYGVDFGKSAKADSEKASYELRTTTEDLPTTVVEDLDEQGTPNRGREK